MPTPITLGFRAARGGGVVTAVELVGDGPRIVLSSIIATAAEGDRLSLEPYHVAFEAPRGAGGEPGPEAVEAVAEGRRRQDALAAAALGRLLQQLRGGGWEPSAAALLVNRAGWITDLLKHSLSHPEHPPVAEGLAVRDALRSAFARHGLPVVEMDETSLPQRAEAALRRPAAALQARVAELAAQAGRPWRKEQKLACLAAWTAAAERLESTR